MYRNYAWVIEKHLKSLIFLINKTSAQLTSLSIVKTYKTCKVKERSILTSHVAKVKAVTSAHYMAVLIQHSLRTQPLDKSKIKYILHAIKKTIFVYDFKCFNSFWRSLQTCSQALVAVCNLIVK